MAAWWEQLLYIAFGRVSRHDELPDLRHLETRPVALERTHYLVNDRERNSQAPRTYVLRAQSRTWGSAGGVAVSSNGRGVGYLPAGAAASIAPLLDQIGGAAIVNGAGSRSRSSRLWVDMPVAEAIGEYIRTAGTIGTSEPRDT